MKALVHGSRVCQVEQDEFPVAKPLRWVSCPDDAKPETHYFDGSQVVAIPPPPPPPVPGASDLETAFLDGASTPPAPQFGFDLRRAFIAKVISDEAYRLGKAPGALTPQELSAIRGRLANIYKAL